ncbi:MAG: nucleotidyltransferase domain-containing protein [Methylobacter sp.]
MRLTDQQRAIIRATVAETFGAGAEVRLFGSRVDDSKRGGDIDLLIETDQVDVDAIARAEISLLTKLQIKLGEQKIDVLLDYPTRKIRPPIFAIAKQTGVLL